MGPKNRPPGRLILHGTSLLRLTVLFSVILLLSCSRDGRGERPNIIVITVESVRSDHVGCYGFDRPTTPAFDELAREGTRYENAHSVTSWTLASHATLLTGLYPTAHQVTGPMDRLGDSYVTLAEHLGANGYQTAGFVSGPFLRTPHNLHQGFELYDDSPSSSSQQDAHHDITNPAMEELLADFLSNRRDSERPFFLFAYMWDPHYDYNPPAPFDTMFRSDTAEPFDIAEFELNPLIRPGMTAGALRYVRDQYEGEIRCTDELLGRLWKQLRDEGLWEETTIILTADHGEEFFEHGGKGHKNGLYDETLHVPLVIKWAGSSAAEVDPRLTGLIDLFPTIVGMTGTASREELHGKSLLQEPRKPEHPLFFELITTLYGVGADRGKKEVERWWAVRRGDFKMISIPDRHTNLLFDMIGDPLEKNSIEKLRPDILEEYLALLPPWQQRMQAVARQHGPPENAFLSNEEIDRLKALGYIGN